jgi:hypothetical protein
LTQAWLCAEQSTQATPPTPHAWSERPSWHVPFWQQPPGHDCGLQGACCEQALVRQAWPWAAQSAQVAPPLPHWASAVPGLQRPFWQQPLAQEVALQVETPHAPARQAWPMAAQSVQAPLVPQALSVVPSMQAPPAQQPLAQAGSQAPEAPPPPVEALLELPSPPAPPWPGVVAAAHPALAASSPASPKIAAALTWAPPGLPRC